MRYDLEEFRKNPQMVFSFGLDQVSHARPVNPRPRTTAEAYAGQPARRPQTPPSRQQQARKAEERRRQQQEEAAERKKRRNTAIGLGIAAVVLIALVLILVVSSCSGDSAKMVEVPNFVGAVYDEIDPAA